MSASSSRRSPRRSSVKSITPICGCSVVNGYGAVRGRGAAYETSWHQTTVAQRRASLDGVDVTVRRLGLVAYLEAWDLQRMLHADNP